MKTKLFVALCVLLCIGVAAVLGPEWTRNNAVEKPAGEKVVGSYTMRVYTKEQQNRLGVNELGQKIAPRTYI